MSDGGDFNFLPQIIGALHLAFGKSVEAAAKAIMEQAMANAPVATGFLQSSIYVELHDSSTYGQGAVPGAAGATMLPEIPKAENDQTAYVAVAASYGIFQELGTARMSPQPYLVPALEAVRAQFESGEGIEAELAKAAQ